MPSSDVASKIASPTADPLREHASRRRTVPQQVPERKLGDFLRMFKVGEICSVEMRLLLFKHLRTFLENFSLRAVTNRPVRVPMDQQIRSPTRSQHGTNLPRHEIGVPEAAQLARAPSSARCLEDQLEDLLFGFCQRLTSQDSTAVGVDIVLIRCT